MTESDSSSKIPDLLDRLARSSEILEAESRSVDVIVRGVEERLSKLGLGIDAWVESRPLRTLELSVSASNVAPRVEHQLGYARPPGHGNQDRTLLIRDAEYVPDSATVSGEYRLARVLEVRTLASASREDQMAALPLLSLLLEQLTQALEERTETIRQARKLSEG